MFSGSNVSVSFLHLGHLCAGVMTSFIMFSDIFYSFKNLSYYSFFSSIVLKRRVFVVCFMDDKPQILAVCRSESLQEMYPDLAERIGISCKAFGRSEDALPYVNDARLLIVSSGFLPFARDFPGSKVLITGGADYKRSDYRSIGVDEVWQNPTPLFTLQGIMRKYASDKPRVLCVDDTKGYLELVCLAVKKAGFSAVPAGNIDDALKEVPSVRAVISDLHLRGYGDGLGYRLLALVREVYDGEQLPFALISSTPIDIQRAKGSQIGGEKQSNIHALIDLVNSIVPQHLKPKE